MRQSCLALLLLVLTLSIVCWPTPGRAKPPDGLSIEWEVGYDGYIQPARLNSVRVVMENNRPDLNISGELVLSYNGVEYLTECELPYPSKKQFYLYFPCEHNPPTLELTVRSKEYTEEFSLYKQFETLQSGDVSILVLSRQPGSLGVINRLPVSRVYRDIYMQTTAELGGGEVQVAYSDLPDIDHNPKYFARADVIVIDDIDYLQATPELVAALKAAVSGGVNLVFSLGQKGQGLTDSLLGELCPLKVTGSQVVTDLGDLTARYGLDATGAAAVLAAGTLDPQAEVVSWAGTLPVIVRQTLGSGAITALAFDFTTQPFKQDVKLQQLFVDHSLTVEQSVDVTDWFVHPSMIVDELRRLAEADPMSPGFVLLFLVIYVVLIGPVNFFALGRLKRRTLVWVTIPLIIVAFAWFGLRTGYLYRGSDNVTSYFQELHLYPKAAYVPYQTVMMVFTAERTSYELEVPDRSAFIMANLPNDPTGNPFGSAGSGGFRGLSGGQVDNSRNPRIGTTQGQWTNKEYMYQGYYDLGAELSTTNLSMLRGDSPGQAAGSFTIDLPFDLHETELLYRGQRQPVGKLAGQGTYEIRQLSGQGNSALDSTNYLVQARERFLTALREASSFGQTYSDEILLVGFTEELPVLAEFDQTDETYNLSLVVVHLPFTARVPDTGPAVITRSWLTGGAGFQPEQRNYYDRNFNPLAMEYRLQKSGYIDLAYEIGGAVAADDVLDLQISSLYKIVGREQYQSPAEVLEVEVLVDDKWRRLNLPASRLYIEVPVLTAMADRIVHVRLRATEDCIYQLGDVTVR